MNPLISIIVPVYNVEEYLPKCLDSIINQTYKNLEIIVVNDGSTDNSGKICDEYGERDYRIMVIHKANRGVSSSRNIGIKNASGEYILFVDSDDEIEKDYVNVMARAVTNSDCDLVISNITDIFNKTEKKRIINTENLSGIFKNDYFILMELLRGPVVKLYKMKIIDKFDIKFCESMKISEDQVFNFQYYSKIKSYKFINYYGYKYFHRKTYSLSKILNKKAFCDDFKKLKIEKEFYDNNFIEKKEYIFCSNSLAVIFKYFFLSEDKMHYEDFKKRVLKIKTLLYGFNYYNTYKQYYILICIKYNLWHVLYWSYKLKLAIQRVK